MRTQVSKFNFWSRIVSVVIKEKEKEREKKKGGRWMEADEDRRGI